MMDKKEAKRLKVDIKWNGRANVCVHCGKVPEIFYVATGHDHTDYEIHWCPCRDTASELDQYKDRIAMLQSEIAKLQAERDAALNEARDFESDIDTVTQHNVELQLETIALKSVLKVARDGIDEFLVANDPTEFGCACDLSVGYLCGPCHADMQQEPLKIALAKINEVLGHA